MKKALCFLLVFVLMFQGFGSFSVAAETSVSWGVTKQASYDTSVPGTTLLWTDPLSQGGMDLHTGKMVRSREADIVFTWDGEDIGANGIIDLGAVNFDSVDSVQDSGYQQLIDAIPGHVYLIKLVDGSYAKVKIVRNLNSFISIQYALGEASQELPDGEQVTYNLAIPGVIFINSDPTSQGGINFTTGKMTKNKADTDIAIYSDDIGSRGIINLGKVDMNSIGAGDIPDTGFKKFADLTVGNVYLTVTHDGEFVVFYVAGVYPTSVDLVYQFIEVEEEPIDEDDPVEEELPIVESIKIVGTNSVDFKPVTLKLVGTLDNGETVDIPSEDVVWSVNNKALGSVSKNGVLTFTKKPGLLTVTASYDGLKSQITYDIYTLSSIKMSPTPKYSPTPVKLSVTATYSNKKTVVISGDKVTWKSSNTKVATVNSKGQLTFTGNSGKVTITATYGGKSTSTTITVGNVVKSLTTTTKLAYSKKPITISITAIYSNGKKVKVTKGVVWKSSNTKVAKVSSTGVVTFTGQSGTVTITATYQGKTISLKTTVSVKSESSSADSFYAGKWELWIPGGITYDGFLVPGATKGTLTIYKDGTYSLNSKKGKWRAAKDAEVFDAPDAIILIDAGGTYDIAVAPHNSKEGYIKLLADSKGTYTDGSKIWIFLCEGYQ
jgi:hypothetical protein